MIYPTKIQVKNATIGIINRSDIRFIRAKPFEINVFRTLPINLMEFPLRAPKARGFLLGSNKLEKLTHQRYLTDEELEEIRSRVIIAEDDGEEEKCPKCGKQHDFDYPKCPYCHYEYF